MQFFEDFVVGQVDVYDAATYTVTEEEIIEVGTRWDPQPFHVDPVAAAASPFGGLVASSVHLFAMAVGIGMAARKDDPVAAVSALGFDNLRLHGPARPGDELFTRSEVLEARPSNSHPDVGVIRIRSDLVNQRDEVIFSFETAALVARRPRSLSVTSPS